LPDGMSPDSTVLEIVSEFIDPSQPQLRQQTITGANQPDFLNDLIIHFGRLAMIGGKAFAVDAGRGYTFGWNPDTEGTLVRKKWHKLPDGSRTFLLESITWKDLQPNLATLDVARSDSTTPLQLSTDRVWP